MTFNCDKLFVMFCQVRLYHLLEYAKTYLLYNLETCCIVIWNIIMYKQSKSPSVLLLPCKKRQSCGLVSKLAKPGFLSYEQQNIACWSREFELHILHIYSLKFWNLHIFQICFCYLLFVPCKKKRIFGLNSRLVKPGRNCNNKMGSTFSP